MKTAVVVIHGIGEQWPMDTIRGFVDAAWTSDPEILAPREVQTYFKPDRITGSFELRRITTNPWRGSAPRRVDFFEFYWAHLMRGNTLGSVLSWLVRLLVRSPKRVPTRLRAGWGLGLTALVTALILFVLTKLKPGTLPINPLILPAIAALGGLFSTLWLRPVAGDAARYLSPSPDNVAARQTIREAGIDLLTKLHASGEYDRIIVAGHSLGAVVGYDILTYAWARLVPADFVGSHGQGMPAMQKLEALEIAAEMLCHRASDGADITAYRSAQRAYFETLVPSKRADGTPLWLISDFVTMGCPLSKAELLLGKDAEDLEWRKAAREAPTCPPWIERHKPPRFSYPPNATARTPHHAAPFAPTVWTNIYFPTLLGVAGDFISGPMRTQLGRAIRDVRVPIGAPLFRHLDYWARPVSNGPAIRALRRALNLRSLDDATLWGGQVDLTEIAAEKLAATILPSAVTGGASDAAH